MTLNIHGRVNIKQHKNAKLSMFVCKFTVIMNLARVSKTDGQTSTVLTSECPSHLLVPGPPAPGWSALRYGAAGRPPRAPACLHAHTCHLCWSPV